MKFLVIYTLTIWWSLRWATVIAKHQKCHLILQTIFFLIQKIYEIRSFTFLFYEILIVQTNASLSEEGMCLIFVFEVVAFSVSTNELGNSSQISYSHVTRSSISIPRLCPRPFGMYSPRSHSLFLSPTEFLLPASSEERCVQHTTQHPAGPVDLPSSIVNIEQCLSRADMNSLWTLIVAIIKMQQRKYYWQRL